MHNGFDKIGIMDVYNNVRLHNIIIESMGGSNQSTLTEVQRQKLKEGKPVLLPGGIKIVKNPKTGKLEGVPEQWVNMGMFHFPFEIDQHKLTKTKNFPEQIRPQQDLPQSIINLINSQPVSIERKEQEKPLQIDLDPQNKYGINLPLEWVYKLVESKISPEDVKSDPQGTINMIAKFENELKESIIQQALISNNQFEDLIANVIFIEQNPAPLFVFDKELGKGAMCKVFYAYDRKKENRKQYACRIIKLNDEKTLKKIKIEVAVMKLCHEKNLVSYHFSYYFKQSLFMFVEFMNAGALTDFVYHFIKSIPQNVTAFIIKEVLLGLNALHEKRQLHRDLKSDNILLSMNGDVKIADFGFAIQLTKQRLNRKSVVGTPAWMAPQLIRKQDYNQKVDIWSLGMVVIELCNGQPPFLRLPHLKAMHNIVSKEPPRIKNFSVQLCDFVEKCLQKNPNDRWNASQLLNHRFIEKIGNGETSRKQLCDMLGKMKKDSVVQLE